MYCIYSVFIIILSNQRSSTNILRRLLTFGTNFLPGRSCGRKPSRCPRHNRRRSSPEVLPHQQCFKSRRCCHDALPPHRPVAPPGRAATLTRPRYRCLRGGFSPRSPGLPTTLPSLTPLPSAPFSTASRYFFTTVHFSTTPSPGTAENRLAPSP